MATLLWRKPPPPQIRQQAIEYCRRVGKPILIGHLSLHLGWWASLADTEALLEDLVSEGLLRRLTETECRTFGVTFAYALV
jgi:hypothetical protein